MRALSLTTDMYVIGGCVRGHHISKHFWTPTIGKMFVCKREPENAKNVYAVAVIANSIVVGHLLRKISEACSLFLRQNKSIAYVDNAINGLCFGRF